MGRPPGSRNRDYATTRHELARRLAGHLVRDDGEPATMTDLASAAGVSATTLKHYFADRDGAFAAAMEALQADGEAYLAQMRSPAGRPPEESVTGLVLGTVAAWRRFGLGHVFASGLGLGLGHPTRGPAFLGGLLEPVLQAGEQLLAAHVAKGELPELDPRETALRLLGPVVLALLHQDALGGHDTRALDVEAFARRHVQSVLGELGH